MILLDASALVMRYLDEPGSDIVKDLPGPWVASAVARVEIHAAIWRATRDGRLDPTTAHSLCSVVDADLARGVTHSDGVALVATRTDILAEACRTAARHGLRALDAIHLATLITVRDRVAPVSGFACFDDRLRAAAATEGFRVLPETWMQ